jgi:hypothetical protein
MNNSFLLGHLLRAIPKKMMEQKIHVAPLPIDSPAFQF